VLAASRVALRIGPGRAASAASTARETCSGISLDHQLLDLQTQCRGEVTDRAERTRCGEGIARCPQRRRLGAKLGERVDERRVADAGLAINED
jgi:hypothetical protein